MNILIVDDQQIFLESMTVLLRQISGSNIYTAVGGFQAIELLDKVKPDVVLLDINMPVMNGLEVAQYIIENYPKIKIIVLTNVDGHSVVLNIVKIVHGFLYKDVDGEELEKCIATVMNGNKYFCAKARELIFDNMNSMDKLPYIQFDKSDLQLITLMADGKSSKEIAKVMDKTEKAVNSRREMLIKKTKTRNGTGLVAYAFYNGLIKKP